MGLSAIIYVSGIMEENPFLYEGRIYRMFYFAIIIEKFINIPRF